MAKQFIALQDYTFNGRHYLAGRPIPADVVERYGLTRVRALDEDPTAGAEAARDEAADAGGTADDGTADGDEAAGYGAMDKGQLQKLADERGLAVTRADGKEGDPLKSDLVAALQAADA